ncbi:hypothetical protein E1B03_09530 [Citrobacter arsenatis]|uniref:Uncharacterized protein n=1 Tax=Citrobacter arsenatis TaxID=2546350 RepID=A0A4P6WLR9_9ENTR|nr:hypothetical protein E1B03_09530 [Citrobacter arsenatis]
MAGVVCRPDKAFTPPSGTDAAQLPDGDANASYQAYESSGLICIPNDFTYIISALDHVKVFVCSAHFMTPNAVAHVSG